MRSIRKHNRGAARSAGRTMLASFAAVLLAANAGAQGHQSVPDVTTLSMEDLMNMQVTSVSKRTQKVADAAAAVFVITQEDIRRSGATSIPEALRLVPGLEVARIDENKWAIASRGFNGRFDNKLLVLIDGRSGYTPLFSGVYGNVQDVMLEDIDRIEVIRGPGATLWGANAVNGVINIISKKAKDTQSGVVTAGAGSEERGSGGVRYGSKIGDTSYRAYGKYFNWGPSLYPTGMTAHDGWDARRVSRGLDTGGCQFFDFARRYLSQQVWGNAHSPAPKRTLFEHLPQQRKLQRGKHPGPVESQLRGFFHVAADVLRQHHHRRQFAVRRPPEYFRHGFPAWISCRRLTAVCMGTGLPVNPRPERFEFLRFATAKSGDPEY